MHERIKEFISRPIVDDILDDLLDVRTPTDDERSYLNFFNWKEWYELNLAHRKWFRIVVGKVMHGLHFRKVALSTQNVRSPAALALQFQFARKMFLCMCKHLISCLYNQFQIASHHRNSVLFLLHLIQQQYLPALPKTFLFVFIKFETLELSYFGYSNLWEAL